MITQTRPSHLAQREEQLISALLPDIAAPRLDPQPLSLPSLPAQTPASSEDRSVDEVVTAAIQEDAQGVAISSYQGGHVEYFTYLVELLRERGAGNVKVYGGGGGVIVPREIALLHERGVSRIFSPEDGQRLGLPGMINLMVRECDVDLAAQPPGSFDGCSPVTCHARPGTLTLAEAGRLPEGLDLTPHHPVPCSASPEPAARARAR